MKKLRLSLTLVTDVSLEHCTPAAWLRIKDWLLGWQWVKMHMTEYVLLMKHCSKRMQKLSYDSWMSGLSKNVSPSPNTMLCNTIDCHPVLFHKICAKHWDAFPLDSSRCTGPRLPRITENSEYTDYGSFVTYNYTHIYILYTHCVNMHCVYNTVLEYHCIRRHNSRTGPRNGFPSVSAVKKHTNKAALVFHIQRSS
jgi:hypothetical protein